MTQELLHYTLFGFFVIAGTLSVIAISFYRLNKKLDYEISEHAKLTESLQASEKSYQILIDNAPCPVVITSPSDDLILYVNPQAVLKLEIFQNHAVGKKFVEFYVNPAENDKLKFLQKTQGSVRDFETQLITTTSHKFWTRVSSSEIIYKNQPAFFYAILDITDIKEKTFQLEEANRSYLLSEAVFRNTTEGIMITNKSAEIISVNPSFTEISGFTEKEAIGKNPHILKSGLQDREFYNELWQKLNDDGQWKGEFHNKRKNGEIFIQESSINAVKDKNGEITNYIAIISDISARKKAEEEIEHMATHDNLTGLPNRLLFQDRLDVAIKTAHREKSKFAIMFMDLDGFKNINDSLGHNAGDLVLKNVAYQLKTIVRESDTVSRMGGDEFILLLQGIHDRNGMVRLAEKIIAALNNPIKVDSTEAQIGCSIGIAIYPEHGDNVNELLKQADIAMYAIKESGKNNYKFAN